MDFDLGWNNQRHWIGFGGVTPNAAGPQIILRTAPMSDPIGRENRLNGRTHYFHAHPGCNGFAPFSVGMWS